MGSSLADQFRRSGFVVVRGLLDHARAADYADRLIALAAGKERWTQPNGINANPDFWPVIFDTGLRAVMTEILGPRVRYLPHNDLHLGFSSFSWHRDNVNRDAGVGPDWDETTEPYRLARVGIYLQRFEDSQFKLGLIPGSHRPSIGEAENDGRVQRRTSALANVLSGLTGVDLVGEAAEWIATDPGDAVIFDPRILHTGSKFHGVKYSMFLAYGLENVHFRNHWHYYLTMRKDLGYAGIDAQLAEQLRAADLLAEAPPADTQVASAWMPSPTYTYVARHFK